MERNENDMPESDGKTEKGAGKKGLGLAILQILREETDNEHPIHQKGIIELLNTKYQMDADRKTIRHNVSMLCTLGYPIEHMNDGWYYEHEFTEPELCLLIDSLPDSLPDKHRSQLVDKLKGLGSRWFSSADDHRNTPEDQEMLLTLDVLRDAIRKHCCVSFHYGHHGTDKQMHLKAHHDGTPRDYIVTPYRTLISAGHYMMLGNTKPYDGITHYRVDRIRDIRLLEEEPGRPLSEVNTSLADVASYLSQRPFMFSDDSVSVRFRISKKCIDDVLDSFGVDVRFSHVTETTVDVETKVSPIAMKYWALQYGDNCELLSPPELRESLRASITAMAQRYGEPQEETKE